MDLQEDVVFLVSVDVLVVRDAWDLLVLLECQEDLDHKVLKVTLEILVHRAHSEDLVLKVLQDQPVQKVSEVNRVLGALQEVWVQLGLKVQLAR